MDLTINYILLSQRKDEYMSGFKPYRTKDEWLSLIQECRKSGLTDIQWCQQHGISHHSFYSAVKRLRKSSYTIPSHKSQAIYDITIPEQDVVKVDIVPDAQPPREHTPEKASHIDNSHMIEITMGDIHISLDNETDPVLVSKTLSLLRSFS